MQSLIRPSNGGQFCDGLQWSAHAPFNCSALRGLRGQRACVHRLLCIFLHTRLRRRPWSAVDGSHAWYPFSVKKPWFRRNHSLAPLPCLLSQCSARSCPSVISFRRAVDCMWQGKGEHHSQTGQMIEVMAGLFVHLSSCVADRWQSLLRSLIVTEPDCLGFLPKTGNTRFSGCARREGT